MPAIQMPRTNVQRAGVRRAWSIRQQLASEVRRAREDAGLSLRHLARAAGVSHATVIGLERATFDPTIQVVGRIGAALGMDLSLRLYPGTGPAIRDHLQAPMIEALIELLHPRWVPAPEVTVTSPVRGVIDLVLEGPEPPLVSCEAQSELRRLEQQLRWSRAKSDALAAGRGKEVSRLLLLRSTRSMRALVTSFAATIAAAYPAPAVEAYEALSQGTAWPGDAILWCHVAAGRATILSRPPRHVRVGR